MALNLPRLSEAAAQGVRAKLPAKPKDVKVKDNHGKIFHDAMKTAYAMQEKGDKEGTKQALAAAMQNIEAMSMHDKEHYAAEYKAFMALCKKYKVEKPDVKHALRAKIMEPAGKNMKDVVKEAKAKDEIDAREAMSARIEGYFGDLENIHKLSTSDIGTIYKVLVDEKQISALKESLKEAKSQSGVIVEVQERLDGVYYKVLETGTSYYVKKDAVTGKPKVGAEGTLVFSDKKENRGWSFRVK